MVHLHIGGERRRGVLTAEHNRNLHRFFDHIRAA